MAAHGKALISASQIEQSILLVRGQKVLLDATLAGLYGVQTKVLLQAVKRNRERFPSDFLFELNKQEVANLRSQFVTSSWGGHAIRPSRIPNPDAPFLFRMSFIPVRGALLDMVKLRTYDVLYVT